MRFLTRILLVAIAAFMLSAAPAAAEEVVLPVGTWINFGVGLLLPGVAILVGWLCRRIPGQIGALLLTAHADQILTKAITFGLNATKGAAPDKVVTVDIANEVVAKALKYFLEHGNQLVIDFVGDPAMIVEKLWARLNLAPEASLDKVGAQVLATQA